MKRNLLYLLPLLMISVAGCLSKPDIVPYPAHPSGSFNGEFYFLHRAVATQKVDTLHAYLSLDLESNGNYTITGDTALVHAGSKGTWGLGIGNDLVFTDKTLPSTITPAKQHLDGDYIYAYDGSTLNLVRGIGDSLSYQYRFTKSSN